MDRKTAHRYVEPAQGWSGWWWPGSGTCRRCARGGRAARLSHGLVDRAVPRALTCSGYSATFGSRGDVEPRASASCPPRARSSGHGGSTGRRRTPGTGSDLRLFGTRQVSRGVCPRLKRRKVGGSIPPLPTTSDLRSRRRRRCSLGGRWPPRARTGRVCPQQRPRAERRGRGPLRRVGSASRRSTAARGVVLAAWRTTQLFAQGRALEAKRHLLPPHVIRILFDVPHEGGSDAGGDHTEQAHVDDHQDCGDRSTGRLAG